MKKIIALIIAIVTVFALAACTTTDKKDVTMDNVKIGVICLHDENSTYDANFINAVKAVQAKLGLKDEQVVIRTGVDESDACYKAAADMADSGCDIVFADSFGQYLLVFQEFFHQRFFSRFKNTRSRTASLAPVVTGLAR